MAVLWGCISRRGRSRGGEGGTDEQPLFDKPSLILTVPGSSNLNLRFQRAHQKHFVLKR